MELKDKRITFSSYGLFSKVDTFNMENIVIKYGVKEKRMNMDCYEISNKGKILFYLFPTMFDSENLTHHFFNKMNVI